MLQILMYPLNLAIVTMDRRSIGPLWVHYKRHRFLSVEDGITYNPAKEYKFTTFLNLHSKNAFYFITKMRGANWKKKQEPISLDTVIYENKDGGEISLLDSLSDPAAEADIENVIESEYIKQLHNDLISAMECLSTKEYQTIEQIYFQGKTHEEVSKEISVNSISTLHERALEKLARYKNLQAYKDEIISRFSYGYSFHKYKNIGMSSTERAILELEKRGLL